MKSSDGGHRESVKGCLMEMFSTRRRASNCFQGGLRGFRGRSGRLICLLWEVWDHKDQGPYLRGRSWSSWDELKPESLSTHGL